MRTKAQQRGDEIRRLKRELGSYKVKSNNIDRFFKAYPEVADKFTIWMLLQIFPPPDGGRRLRKAA